jgi:hypothetical protein
MITRTAAWSCLALFLVGTGCGSSPLTGEIVRLDDASDEELKYIVDIADRNGVAVDPALAVTLTAPADGDTVSAATPYTFTWAKLSSTPRRTPRHGVITGTFMWLRLEGGGLDPMIDMVALTSMSWTPDATLWARIAATTGPIKAHMITTVTDGQGQIVAGPARAAANDDVTFTVGP